MSLMIFLVSFKEVIQQVKLMDLPKWKVLLMK